MSKKMIDHKYYLNTLLPLSFTPPTEVKTGTTKTKKVTIKHSFGETKQLGHVKLRKTRMRFQREGMFLRVVTPLCKN